MTVPTDSASHSEPGSFRDPESRVFHAGGEIYRALSARGLADFEALTECGLLDDARIIGTERVEDPPDAGSLLHAGVAAVLRHERVPFVSYPYEWPFSMLKDAALLQLDLLTDALERGLVLKDSTPYNVQFLGPRPLFIDVGAFERLREGELWVGYRQFCMLYLFPLLLQAVKGVGFQPWLRGSLEGITATELRDLLSLRDRFRRGFFTHVFLQARLEQRDARSREAVRRQVAKSGAERRLILANVRKMRRLTERLDWRPPTTAWARYETENSYEAGEADLKENFVRAAVRTRHWPLIWDLGANTGRYSRIAAEAAEQVVAIDADQASIEMLYRELRSSADKTILPLTIDLADPSPSLGWRGRERMSLLERRRPDLVLALALIHHITIGANVPVSEFVDWLAEIGAPVIIEFPGRGDPMVEKLLARKRPGLHSDYDQSFFERCLSDRFELRARQELMSGGRILYLATPRNDA
jgi:SAM-dependent methyltransferase